MEAALYNELHGDAAITALVEARITPLFAPDYPEDTQLAAVKPHLVYRLSDASVAYGTTYARLSESYDVLCCANNFDSMLDLAEAVIEQLQGGSRLFGGVGGVQIESCLVQGYSDESSYEMGLFARRLTFAVQRIRT